MRRETILLAIGFIAAIAAEERNGMAVSPLDRIELELAAERSVGAVAQRRWLDRLRRVGVARLRVRRARPGETPKIDTRAGSPARYHVVAILPGGNRLTLPGKTFSGRDVSPIERYLTRLVEEGVEGVTAARGAFGLTKKQFEAIHTDLASKIDFKSKGVPLAEIVERLQPRLRFKIEIDASAERQAASATAADELNGLAAGTALAIWLRAGGLALRPEVVHGYLQHRIIVATVRPREPNPASEESSQQLWPVGYKPQGTLRKVLPVLLERINIQIEGYTLGEALEALRERIDTPFLFDHFALAEQQIDPNKIDVHYPPRKANYKSILDHILFQAKLKGTVRADENGKVFYWITTIRRTRS